MTALSPNESISSEELIPQTLIFKNFIEVWQQIPLARFILNSLLVSCGATLLNLTFAFPASYGLARFRFRARTPIMFLILVTQMFSPMVFIFSAFRLVVAYGLVDNLLSLVLFDGVFTLTFSIWLLTSYIQTIPYEIEEAAMIDGCSRVRLLKEIVLPLAKPGIITSVAYVFIESWNDFLFALSFITSPEKSPVTIGIFIFSGRYHVEWGLLMTSALLATLPVVILFFFFQKQLVGGLSAGAIK
jgi:multiple sugar transport system permease protein